VGKAVDLLPHPVAELQAPLVRVATVFLEAMPPLVEEGVDIMEEVVADTNLLEPTLQLPVVADPATRATSAMPPCKRAFAMGMDKSLLPIK
jgi:hypothetical protein